MRRKRSSSSIPAVAGAAASTSGSTSKKRTRPDASKPNEEDDIIAEHKDHQQQQQQGNGMLPDELWDKILEDVDDNSVTAFASVCKQLRRVQQESGRRLKTNLGKLGDWRSCCHPEYIDYFPERLQKVSPLSENWCIWSLTLRREWKYTICIMNAAAFWGHLDALKHWREQRISNTHAFTCTFAALGGQLEVLMWLIDNGYPWDERTCAHAAYGGHLEVLKYAHEKGCPWDADTCQEAARGGHLEVLKYAHENGCPWDWRTCRAAASQVFSFHGQPFSCAYFSTSK